jgi:hypothetical protein
LVCRNGTTCTCVPNHTSKVRCARARSRRGGRHARRRPVRVPRGSPRGSARAGLPRRPHPCPRGARVVRRGSA